MSSSCTLSDVSFTVLFVLPFLYPSQILLWSYVSRASEMGRLCSLHSCTQCRSGLCVFRKRHRASAFCFALPPSPFRLCDVMTLGARGGGAAAAAAAAAAEGEVAAAPEEEEEEEEEEVRNFLILPDVLVLVLVCDLEFKFRKEK